MQIKLLSFLSVLGFVLVQSTPIGEFFEAGNANAFVDQIVTTIKTQYGKDLDPFHVPDKTIPFDKKVGILDLKGDIKLTQGVITGLSHLKRSGDSTVGTENSHFAAHIQLGDNNVKVHFNVQVDFLKIFHPHLVLESEIENIDLKADIGVGADGKPTLTGLLVDELKHVKVQVHGLGPLDPLVDVIADEFIKVFNPQARDLISGILKGMVGDLLKDFKMPGTAY